MATKRDVDDDRPWQMRAACTKAPLALVDAAYAAPGSPAGEEFKRRFCHRCTVWRECLDAAMTTGEAGIWGGTTPHMRSHHGAPPYHHRRKHPHI